MLGDSVTFGNRLAREENFSAVLESLYQQAGKKVEVLNLFLGGYDTLQEVAFLEHRGLQYRPDLVVVGYCLNDVGIVAANLEYIERLQKYRSRLLLSVSRLAQLVVTKTDELRMGSWMEWKNRLDVFAKDYAGSLAPIAASETELHVLMRRVSSTPPSPWYGDEIRIQRLRVDRVEAAGRHVASWDGRNARGDRLAAGVYFARVQLAGAESTRKLVLLR